VRKLASSLRSGRFLETVRWTLRTTHLSRNWQARDQTTVIKTLPDRNSCKNGVIER